ncbi:hypothetical protein [Limnohabitans planktonicus]|uniref:Uncharacterized protein n=1 Tax=Limnohabitans planktonicus II-D5 TaxID=1293045 RepID=A0A2T7UDT2_9BURK|nr:hypothetical protein [Limnohabitans planktonicus]PVE42856.1 hypothetical protein H663_010130 [Limnohabitans planktonicus II-D5]
MSFMLVAGKIYHCTDCNKEIRIDYEGGAQVIQVSDAVIEQQNSLLELFPQPHAEPHKYGYFIHADAICEHCTKIYESQQTKLDRMREVFDLLDGIELAKQSVANDIHTSFSTFSDEDIQAVIGAEAFKELVSPHMNLHRKRRYINQLFQKWYCTDNFIKSIINENKEKIKSAIRDVGLQEWIAEFKKQEVVLHSPLKTWEPENLNPYIRSSATMAFPAADTLHITVYKRHALNMAGIKNMTNLSAQNFIDHYIKTDVCRQLVKQATLARFAPETGDAPAALRAASNSLSCVNKIYST